MLTRIDHVMICVPELAAGVEAYRRIGFDVYAGGEPYGPRHAECHRLFAEDYLELLSLREDPE